MEQKQPRIKWTYDPETNELMGVADNGVRFKIVTRQNGTHSYCDHSVIEEDEKPIIHKVAGALGELDIQVHARECEGYLEKLEAKMVKPRKTTTKDFVAWLVDWNRMLRKASDTITGKEIKWLLVRDGYISGEDEVTGAVFKVEDGRLTIGLLDFGSEDRAKEICRAFVRALHATPKE